MLKKEQRINFFSVKSSYPYLNRLFTNKSKEKKTTSMTIQKTSLIMSNIKQYKNNIAKMHYNRIINENLQSKLPKITSEIKRRETAMNQGQTQKKLVIIPSMLNDSLHSHPQLAPKCKYQPYLPLCYLKLNNTPRPKYVIPNVLGKINNRFIFKGLKKSLSNSVY